MESFRSESALSSHSKTVCTPRRTCLCIASVCLVNTKSNVDNWELWRIARDKTVWANTLISPNSTRDAINALDTFVIISLRSASQTYIWVKQSTIVQTTSVGENNMGARQWVKPRKTGYNSWRGYGSLRTRLLASGYLAGLRSRDGSG